MVKADWDKKLPVSIGDTVVSYDGSVVFEAKAITITEVEIIIQGEGFERAIPVNKDDGQRKPNELFYTPRQKPKFKRGEEVSISPIFFKYVDGYKYQPGGVFSSVPAARAVIKNIKCADIYGGRYEYLCDATESRAMRCGICAIWIPEHMICSRITPQPTSKTVELLDDIRCSIVVPNPEPTPRERQVFNTLLEEYLKEYTAPLGWTLIKTKEDYNPK